ncbi:MAG TPA: sce7726 family protein [Longimicrobium sp.]|nr:sce7726 family protein [Longimicrobium sp.]
MRDIDVRIALRQSDLAQFANDGESRVVEEMGIFRGEYRIDAAVVNGHLHGYEIKSAKDTLARLPTQAAAYGAVFDFVTLVAAVSHLERATNLVPSWWGLRLAEPIGTSVLLTPIRQATRNPSVDPYHVAQLLWKSEALELLDQYGGARGFRKKPTFTIWRELTRRLDLPELQREVRAVLKLRQTWPSAGAQLLIRS